MGRPSPAPPRWGRSRCPPAAREPAESRPRARHASRPPRGSSDWQWPRARETSRRKRSWLRWKVAGRSSAARETGRKEPRATNEMAGRGPRSYSATTLSVSSRAWRARTKLPGRRTWKLAEVPGAAPSASRTNSARGRRELGEAGPSAWRMERQRDAPARRMERRREGRATDEKREEPSVSDGPGAKRAAGMYTHISQVLEKRRASGRSTPWGWISSCTCLGRRCGPGSRRSRGRSGVGAHRAGTRCRPCGSARTRWKPWAGRASRQRSGGGASAAAGGRGGRRGTVRKAQAWVAR